MATQEQRVNARFRKVEKAIESLRKDWDGNDIHSIPSLKLAAHRASNRLGDWLWSEGVYAQHEARLAALRASIPVAEESAYAAAREWRNGEIEKLEKKIREERRGRPF